MEMQTFSSRAEVGEEIRLATSTNSTNGATMESLRKLIALAGFIACLTVSVTAQDFNKRLRKAILDNG
jgi:hypothetical protein